MSKLYKNTDSNTDTNSQQTQNIGFKISQYIKENQQLTPYVLGGVLAVVALFFAYKYWYLVPREKEALNAIYRAEELFARDSFAMALENPGGGYEGFLGVIDEFGGTKTGNLAKYYAGVCYLNLGKYEEAVEYLTDYSSHDEITTITKNGTLGDAFAELGKKDDAYSHYEKAASGNNDMLTPYYLYKLAMLQHSEGKTADAVKLLERIKTDFPRSMEYRDAERFLVRFSE